MGIRSLEHYIQKIEHEELKEIFQSMEQDQKLNAGIIAERIQHLSGVSADNEGISESKHSLMHKLMHSDEPDQILEDTLKGLRKMVLSTQRH